MSFSPKVLNKINTGYGPKQSQEKWNASRIQVFGSQVVGNFVDGIMDSFEAGEYTRVIEDSLKRLKSFRTIDDLKNMTEADIVNFYLLGISYLRLRETQKATSCFHIILSQHIFMERMLSGYSSYIDSARSELEELAKQYGERYVVKNEPSEFLRVKGDGGRCFIATSVYGSEYEKEVMTLKAYRDKILLPTYSGRIFVKFYYLISPKIVKVFEGCPKLSKLIRDFLLEPLVKRIQSSTS